MITLKVSNLCVSYDQELILNNVSFSLYQGEILAVIGPNGSGKTTLLKSILGIKSITMGSIFINDYIPSQAIKKFRGLITYLPQQHYVNLLLPLTVYDVVAQSIKSRKFLGIISQEDNNNILYALERVNLSDKKNELFMNLSGGQRQRVLLASAISSKPKLLFLDEPTTGLDISSIDQIYRILFELKQDMGIMIVSHDISTIVSSSDKVMVLMNEVKYFGEPCNLSEDMIHHIFGSHIKIIPNDPDCHECRNNVTTPFISKD